MPKKIILLTGIILVAGHNFLDTVHVSGTGLKAFLWSIFHEQKFFDFSGKSFLVAYPLLPWLGVMALGYSLGSLYSEEFNAAKRKKLLLYMGTGSIILFIILRYINVFGDPFPWSKQSSPLLTLLSFIRVNKYPPSLLFLLITLGPALIFLAITEKKSGWLSKKISVYGRVPMFYYIIHVYLIHLLAMASTILTGYDWKVMIWPPFRSLNLQGFGFSLGVVYAVWVFVILLMFPLCKWYDNYKQRNKQKWWLSYL